MLTHPPANVTAYKRTPVFTQISIPAGLTRDHATKPGVWGVIHVLKGWLEYSIPSKEESITIGPGGMGVIEPEVLHKVGPVGDIEFFVEFWR